jgi:hypothetical protein
MKTTSLIYKVKCPLYTKEFEKLRKAATLDPETPKNRTPEKNTRGQLFFPP